MGLEYVICIVGFVVIIYFACRSRPEKKVDNLTHEIRPKGLSPEAPWNSWIPPQ